MCHFADNELLPSTTLELHRKASYESPLKLNTNLSISQYICSMLLILSIKKLIIESLIPRLLATQSQLKNPKVLRHHHVEEIAVTLQKKHHCIQIHKRAAYLIYNPPW